MTNTLYGLFVNVSWALLSTKPQRRSLTLTYTEPRRRGFIDCRYIIKPGSLIVGVASCVKVQYGLHHGRLLFSELYIVYNTAAQNLNEENVCLFREERCKRGFFTPLSIEKVPIFSFGCYFNA